MITVDELADALRLGRHEHVAVVGGGGKTTLVHALGRALTGRRLLTTTTKMGHDQHRGAPLLLGPDDGQIAAIDDLAVAWGAIDGERALGVDPEDCDRWFRLVDHVIVEADGSRRLPFKAPGDYEPVVPSTATVLISVMGADALGVPIARGCHRPELVAALAGCTVEEPLTPERAARVLTDDRGQLKARPVGARAVIAITKVDEVASSAVDRVVAALAAAPVEVVTIAAFER